MSLLLDALRQAEKNKLSENISSDDKASMNKEDPNLTFNSTAPSRAKEKSSRLVELDLLPEFDLTIDNDIQPASKDSQHQTAVKPETISEKPVSSTHLALEEQELFDSNQPTNNADQQKTDKSTDLNLSLKEEITANLIDESISNNTETKDTASKIDISTAEQQSRATNSDTAESVLFDSSQPTNNADQQKTDKSTDSNLSLKEEITANPIDESISKNTETKDTASKINISTAEQQSKDTNSNTAESILQLSDNSNNKSAYLWITLFFIIALLAATWYLYSLTQPIKHNPAYQSTEIENGLLIDDVSESASTETTASDPNIEQQNSATSANTQANDAIAMMAKPELTSASPSNNPQPKQAIERQSQEQSSSAFLVEDDNSSIDYPHEVQIKIKRQPPSVYHNLNKAYRAYIKQDYTTAELLYKQVLRHKPSNIDALLGLGTVAEHYGYIQRAQILFEKVLRLDANQTVAHNALIRLQKNKNPSERESRYKTLQQNFPDNVQSYVALAHLYISQQRWKEAQQAYFKAIEHDPGNADYHFNLAISLDHLKKKDIALRYYRLALQLAKNSKPGFNQSAVESRIQQLQGQ